MSKRTILINEAQVQQMVENIVAKSKGEATTEVKTTINESVEATNSKPKRIVKINETDFKKMILELSKKVGGIK